MHTIVDGGRLPGWTMLRTGVKLWVGLVPEFHLHFQAVGRAALV